MTEVLPPKEPDTDKGRAVREQYFSIAKATGKTVKNYSELYQRYAPNSSVAQTLDQEVTRVALKAGNSARQVIQLLAQGPFTQHQAARLSPEEKQAALSKLLQYAQQTVNEVQQQRYLEYACAVIGKIQSYPDLYREYVGSDLAAIQLDQKVTAAALGSGETPQAVGSLLQQGPYARFQMDVQHVPPSTIEQYAHGTVAQVQAIQGLQRQAQRTPTATKDLEL